MRKHALNKNILVICPHMDDEVLGCGGTIVRHAAAGNSVWVCIVANRAYEHRYDPVLIEREKDACRKAQGVLGYQELVFLDLPDEKLDESQINLIIPLEKLIDDVRPSIVYLPHRGDLNQDHRAVFEAVRVVCRPHARHFVRSLRAYEVPSSSDQLPLSSEWPFLPNYYVDISTVLEQKISAFSCYEAETRPYPHPRSPEGLRIYAQKRGMETGLHAAEAFVVLRDGWLQDES